MNQIQLLGCPVDDGAATAGCDKGPTALRQAGLIQALWQRGWRVRDHGDITVDANAPMLSGRCDAPSSLLNVSACSKWTTALRQAAFEALIRPGIPLFLGGDHVMATGTVSGAALAAQAEGRPFFVLWLDAHADYHTPETTVSGNLHGTPVAYFTGEPGFDGCFPPLPVAVAPQNVRMVGVRSVDQGERSRLASSGIEVLGPDDDFVSGLHGFLSRVCRANGRLHVSFDVDVLDPKIAPAVGTPETGGLRRRAASLLMKTLRKSGLVSSVDVAEFNPSLGGSDLTARLLVDLIAELFGDKHEMYSARKQKNERTSDFQSRVKAA